MRAEAGTNRRVYPESEKIRSPPLTARIGSDSMPAMSGPILTPADRAHLLRMMRRHTPSPVHRRMNALLLLDDGWAVTGASIAHRPSGSTVRLAQSFRHPELPDRGHDKRNVLVGRAEKRLGFGSLPRGSEHRTS